MKLLVFFLLVTGLLAFSAKGISQATAYANASVNIVSPISIEGIVVDNIIKTHNDEETIKILPKTSSKKMKKSSFLLPLIKKRITFAMLNVNGPSSSVYDLSLPASAMLKTSSGEETIVAFDFNIGPKSLLIIGKNKIKLSTTIALATDQPFDIYSSTPIDVTVNYN